MNKQEAIDFVKFWLDMNEDSKNSDTYKFMEYALKLINDTCEDKISRESIIDAINNIYEANGFSNYSHYSNLIDRANSIETSDIYKKVNSKISYTIMKDDKYYNGARLIGTDSDGIIRICKTKWEDELTYVDRRMPLEKAKNILRGILKYDKDKNSQYKIVEIEVNSVTEVNELESPFNDK